ncbi:MAG: ATP-binding cassette domain-containing protein [Lentisphaeria bacterium]|nr:ATP-binding cassette domain-containing protein [Lentisphaeria bacterium]
MANIVEAVGLVKEFRDFWNRPKARAVNDIDFEVKEGEVIGLLGPNGSGKSTTVKMLLGLLYPTGGRLTVFGTSPRSVAAKRMIGYLPEETYLYKYLTAYETLDFFGSLFGLSAQERKKRAEQLLDMVGLSHAANRRVGEFSKGMARRIGLAQAMINDPAFLILDEPTSGLDPIGCREVKDLILLLKRRGKTVLVTSHLLSDVEDVCDRVIILYGGKIRAQGTMDELLSVKNTSRITIPDLPDEALAKIENVIRETTGADFTIDHPRKTLEDFFLNVVDDAKKESIATSGATSGGEIADYLSEGEISETGKEKLARLSGMDIKEEAAPETEAPVIAEESRKKLSELEDKVEVAEEKPLDEEARQQMDEANKKLSDLLSGK